MLVAKKSNSVINNIMLEESLQSQNEAEYILVKLLMYIKDSFLQSIQTVFEKILSLR